MSHATLTVDEARARLLAAATPLAETETLAADLALGRVLARPLVAAVTVPPLDNSAMDGYALRLADAADGAWLPIGQRIPAGHPGGALKAGDAARIFTGAPVPEGADTVVMQEDCETDGDRVRVVRPAKAGANIRRAGEDIRAGQAVLAAGQRLTPARLGVAASVGATELAVYRRLRVAVFFTGDEIVMPGQALAPGRIYNSNRASLRGLLGQLGCEIVDLGQVPDRLDATLAVLEQAAAAADVVITSGGVSVGEEDHVKAALERLGRIDMWQVAMKPGKPLVYGRVGAADFLGLPGNPVSAYVVFCLFARPFLLARMGAEVGPVKAYTVPAGFDWPKPGKRREYLRARYEDGRALLYPSQSSGVLTSLAWADGLVDIAAGATVKAGDPVAFLPMTELLA
ncbi:molybdopterin molybdenumtransferase MoeA [Parasulfuritortus cantonensis]|uniref:Molybdopterin molybdenumtransferase n=1 Tax=Parasulfuritortus cantonensis TaxID=2528202 RepID=A0A4V6NB03_9PROT|nr:gephyrin-like molybdotransferase Glp [Parasulfuritortus cantonensis]TCJ15392.1 molybdopterin molybdenumtransferase MoeA [Parasulfuritortus cantonensis]